MIIINSQGFVLPEKKVIREISWCHLNIPVGETIQVYEPDYKLTSRDRKIVRVVTKYVHGLKYRSFPTRGLCIKNNDVESYIKNLYEIYGCTFAYKGNNMVKEILEKLEIPSIDLDVPKCIHILGEGCSMYKCMYYKNYLLKNESQINGRTESSGNE